MHEITLEQLQEQGESLHLDGPTVVTSNDTPVFVIEPYEDYVRRQETIALLKRLSIGIEAYKQGKYYSTAEVKARLFIS